MMYINAFLLGGILCALFQIFMMFTKLDPPRILVLGIALGALLTPYGMMDALGSWGGAGLALMCIGAGNAIGGSFMAFLGGNPVPIAIILGLLMILTSIGIVSGAVRVAVTKGSTNKNVGAK